MRLFFALALFFTAGLAGLGQTPAATPTQELPKDPGAILAAAAPYYDFSDPALKPFHMKASYQLYDDNGKPAEQGTFEYWWASPKVNRVTWTRGDSTSTDWSLPDGKHAYLSTGGFNIFEHKLEAAFFSPLPEAAGLDPKQVRLERDEVKLGALKLPCVEVIPLMPQHGQLQVVPLGLFPTYCFEPKMPALRARYSFGSFVEGFDSIVKFEDHYLPKQVQFYENARPILSAKVETIEGILATNPALTPDTRASRPTANKVTISAGMMAGFLTKQVRPFYPQSAKQARISGTVILAATIGRDGRVHDLRVVQTPAPALAASALWAVSQWQYKPYLLNGEPVEVDTTVNVIYTLY